MSEHFKISRTLNCCAMTLFASISLSAAAGPFDNLDRKAISIRLPADIQWKGSATGVETIALAGDASKPVPAGSFVTHYANEVHYDGAKDADTVLEIVGMGPETLTPAEAK